MIRFILSVYHTWRLAVWAGKKLKYAGGPYGYERQYYWHRRIVFFNDVPWWIGAFLLIGEGA